MSQQTNGRDRWKCPGCGEITVEPIALIAACGCGCERVQLREWPNGPEDWEAPDWPEWSEYSPDPYDNETRIVYEGVYEGGKNGRHVVEADSEEEPGR